MGDIFSASNLKTAAVITLAVMIASNFTSTSSTLVKGFAMFGGALAGGYVATKI
jgi:hypothetical protein